MACGDEAFQRIEDGTANTSDLNVAIGCLRDQISELKNDIKSAGNEASTFNGKIGDTKNLLKDVRDTLKGSIVNMKEFTRDQQAQYQLAEQLAKSYKETALQIGLSVGRSEMFSKEFKFAAANVAKFGGEVNDVQEIYKDFADNSGRVRILGADEVENIYKLGAAANMIGDEASTLFEAFELMGVSNLEATERMEQLIEDSQKVGLNSSKVVKTMAQNMKTMQTYSFANGVKGMTEMSKLAVKMRLDVSDMLGMADKFYEPEGAIEAAANLQMLGGDIAKAFGDPFETMYLARNKPEELAKRLQDMTENMMQFNEETNQYEFPPEVRMQLKAAGDQLGIDVSKMTEMAMQTSKLKDVKIKLNMSGNITDEDMKEGIANLARIDKNGDFVVDFIDKNGEKVTQSIDKLTSGEAEMVLNTPQDEKDYMGQMLYNSRTTNERIEDLNNSFQKAFVGNVDAYKLIEDSTKQTITTLQDRTLDAIKEIEKSFKNSSLTDFLLDTRENVGELDQFNSGLVNQLFDKLELKALEDKNFEIPNVDDINIENGSVNIRNSENVSGQQGSENVTGGVDVNDSSSVQFRPNVNNVGVNGGNLVTTTPSKIEFGELKISGKIDLVSPDGSVTNLDIENSKTDIVKTVISHLNGTFRDGGTPTSKQTTDTIGII
jgi:hypothetical protein